MMQNRTISAPEPTRLRRQNRALGGVLVLLAVIILLIAAFPHFMERTGLKMRALEAVSTTTGVSLSASGPMSIRTLPGAQISISRIEATGQTQALEFTAETLTADFSVLQLLFGKLELNTLTLADAKIRWDMRKPDFIQETPTKFFLKLAKNLALAADVSPKALSCTRCTIIVIDKTGRELVLDSFNGRWNWNGAEGPVHASANFVWRGELVEFKAQTGDIGLISEGGKSPFTMNFQSELASLLFDGTFSLADEFFTEGRISFKATSLKRFLEWSEPGKTAGDAIADVELNSDIVVKEGTLRLSGLDLSVSKVPATGTFEIDFRGDTPNTGGTLAFSSIDLSAFLNALPIGSDSPASLGLLDRISLDLRLSAEKATLGEHTIANAAGAIRILDGTATLDLGTGDVASGNVQGHLSITGPVGNRTGEFAFQARDIVPGELSRPESGLPGIGSSTDVKLDLSGPYAGLRQFFKTASGNASISADAGVLRNFSMDAFEGDVKKGANFELSKSYAGLSELNSAQIEARIQGGLLLLDRGEISIGGMQVWLGGIMPLADHGLALNGRLANSRGSDEGTWFFIGGTLERPVVASKGLNP